MTEFLISGRGTGKSFEAIRWVRGAGNRYLIVPDSTQLYNLLRMDRAESDRLKVSRLHPEKIMSYSMSATRHGLGQNVEFGVDNLDALLSTIFGRAVGFVTATGTLVGHHSNTNTIQIGDTT